MLPRHPLLRTGDVKGVCEAEFVFGIIVTRKIAENGCHSQL
jgi:hypothetical protein